MMSRVMWTRHYAATARTLLALGSHLSANVINGPLYLKRLIRATRHTNSLLHIAGIDVYDARVGSANDTVLQAWPYCSLGD